MYSTPNIFNNLFVSSQLASNTLSLKRILYLNNQYLVINIGGLNVDTGANLSIFSDDLGKKVGVIRILRRSGTMAIAVVIQASDIINSGDKIIE